MITASRKLWKRFADKERRRAFAQNHIANFLAMQIFKMRSDRGWSQSKLAKKIGSSQPQVSEWEGSCESVSLKSLQKLADAFDVAVSVKFVPYSEMLRDALVSSADRSILSFDEESPEDVSHPKLIFKSSKKLESENPKNGSHTPYFGYARQKVSVTGTETAVV